MPLTATVLPKTDSLIRLGINCPFCGFPFHPGDHVIFCPADNTPHHAACWQQNGNHCTLLGCTGVGEVVIPDDTKPKRTPIVPFVVGGIVLLSIGGLLISGLIGMDIVSLGSSRLSSTPINVHITSTIERQPSIATAAPTRIPTSMVQPTTTPTVIPTLPPPNASTSGPVQSTRVSPPQGCPVPVNGDLFIGSGKDVYIYQNGTLRWIPDPETYKAITGGYDWTLIKIVSDSCLQFIGIGQPLPSVKR